MLPTTADETKLLKMAGLYANAFGGEPWNMYKVCQDRHYFGRQYVGEICTCGLALTPFFPANETADYISNELSKSEGTLFTVEKEGEVLAAGWGYACTIEELKAKYKSPKMKELVESVIKVDKVFYLSEIMVDESMQRMGIAKEISNCLSEKAMSLNLNLVVRTNRKSPMMRIANQLKMTEVIENDYENSERVLYMRKC